MKVLITGGAGFIGSKIAKHCARKGLLVRVFDLVKTGIPGVEESLTGSILDPYEISKAIHGCDLVVHAAAALGVQRTETRRLECLHINIQGTVNVLEAAVKERVKKVLFTSSSEVYGDQDLAFYDEETPLMPKSNYAITKLVGEEYLRAYHLSYRIPYTVVRLFSVYGENQMDAFVIPKFAQAIAKNEGPTVYGDGNQLRSFCHVEDAASGAVAALLSDKANQEIFNIGDDREPITIGDLAQKMITLSGKTLKARFVDFSEADREARRDIRRRIPGLQKARKILGYEPGVMLDEGLKRVLTMRNLLGKGVRLSNVG